MAVILRTVVNLVSFIILGIFILRGEKREITKDIAYNYGLQMPFFRILRHLEFSEPLITALHSLRSRGPTSPPDLFLNYILIPDYLPGSVVSYTFLLPLLPI